MTFEKRFTICSRTGGMGLVCLGLVLWAVSCEKGDIQQNKKAGPPSAITVIESEAHFNRILETSEKRLLLFEFYADWCAPCKILEPILEDLAEKYKAGLSIYKIDYDDNRKLSKLFKVQGLPYVGFVKDKVIIHFMLGLYPKQSYLAAIERYLN